MRNIAISNLKVEFNNWHKMDSEAPKDWDLCLLYGDGKMYTGGWVEQENHFYLNCGWGGGLIIEPESVEYWITLDDYEIKEVHNE